ncbi:MAG TPA: hypothetical protein VK256_00280 [Candidatus Eisenbacteria bacterium]|nr:hypothetical protein [Candidatus Eisenbacteria bacterium]
MFRFAITAALVSLALASAACSVPGVGAAKPSPSPDPYKQALLFSKCMREHGVPDFPDPQSTASGNAIKIDGSGATLDPSSSQFQAAAQACNKYSPMNGPNGKAPSAKDRAAMLAFAACMRSHGVPDFPDPQFNNGGGGFVVQGGAGQEPPADMRPDSPQFQAAFEACKSKMPGGGQLSTSGGSR